MKILLLGASGTIGMETYETLSQNHHVIGTYCQNKPDYIPETDCMSYHVEDLDTLIPMLDYVKPDIIISALRGDFQSQREAHEILAKYTRRNAKKLLFLSSVRVFDAKPNRRYFEHDIPLSVSPYGTGKFECERILSSILDKQLLILRLPSVYSKDTAYNMLRGKVQHGDEIYSNMYQGMNTAKNVATIISYCIENDLHGTVHASSTDSISQEKLLHLFSETFDMSLNGMKGKAISARTYGENIGCFEPSIIRESKSNAFVLSLASANALPSTMRLSIEEMAHTFS